MMFNRYNFSNPFGIQFKHKNINTSTDKIFTIAR